MENNFELVKVKLKEEFFGIDEQIEQVVKSFETWLSVKDYQNRPMTVCLWGLTGTGKTALINRAIEILDLNKKKFYIKFGSKTSRIDDDFEMNDCEDTIFVLDEFQYFKTKKESGDEIDRDEDNSTNIIWELLDGGVVNLYGQANGYSYEKLQLISTLHVLKTLDSIGAELSNGIVFHPELGDNLKKLHVPLDKIKNIEEEKLSYESTMVTDRNYVGDSDYYDVEIEEDDDDDDPNAPRNVRMKKKEKEAKSFSQTESRLRSVMQINWGILYDFVQYRDTDYNFMNKVEFYDFLKNFSEIPALIKFLQIIRDSKPKLETRNYCKSLIFVLGNLDECFTMSGDLNSDLDADYFYERTKNISIIDIRRALLKRFRAEQIARLGSTHIIYPSLSKKAFKSIISKELLLFEKMTKEKFQSEENVMVNSVLFSENINELIYKEGVFPVVGARSVFSIVNEIISDKFPVIIKNILSFDVSENKSIDVKFEYNKKSSIIEILFYDSSSTKLVNKETFKYSVKIDKLRTEKDKGKQIHRAVHEAGHAICSVVLEHSFPEVVYSVVLDDRAGGFNLLNSDDFYYHRKNTYMNRIGTMLGGYSAESMIFGDDNVSSGSSSDIDNATSLLNTLMKDTGFMNDMIGKYVSKSFVSTLMENANYTVTDHEDVINEKIKELLKEGLKIATDTLGKQKVLFLKVSEYLSKNPKMTNKKLKELTKKYIVDVNYDDILKNKQLFYVEMFNDKLKEITL